MTEIEKLPGVLKGLAELAPERFRRVNDLSAYEVQIGQHGTWYAAFLSAVDGDDDIGALLIQAACQEECEAREWGWVMSSRCGDDGARYQVHLYSEPNGYTYLRNIWYESPSLAIASALRDALKT